MPAKDAYSKRNSLSIAAPLEVDSDSDFNPGAYVPEPPPKKKSRPSTAPTARNKRKRGVASDILGSKSKKPEKRHRVDESNALLQYFEADLDLHSASEDDEEEIFVRGPARESEDEADEEREDEEDDRDDDEPVAISKASFMYREPEPASSSQAPPESSNNPPKGAPVVDDDSVTESDTDSPPPSSLANKMPSGQTKPAVNDSATESETESDTDPEPGPSKVAPPKISWGKAVAKPSPDIDNSETESDTEPEEELNETHKLRPKPGFPLRSGQKYEPALVLDEAKGIKIPAAINTYLRDYQRDGVKFLWRQYSEGRGGLLGDDMGLGKTIQVISFLSAIMKKDGLSSDKDRRHNHISRLQDGEAWRKRRELPKANAKWPTCLIIAPSTVVHNWQREFETWGYFEVGMYNGQRKDREDVLHDFKLGRFDVVVTSFDLARRDIDILDELPWSCIIVDEVHRVKNESSKIALAYHQFACRNRFGLTGTTIQNSYKEMWTILDWTNPGRLGTARQWQGYVVKPLTAGQSTGASEEGRAKALVVALILRDKLLPNFFLRRTKDIIKDQLPRKTDQVVFCPLTDRQIAAYKHLLTMEPVQNLLKRDSPCDCESRKPRKNCCHPFIPGEVFRFMSILIKLSNHLGLILPGPTDTPEQTARNRTLSEIAFPEGNIPKYGAAMMQPEYCGKWRALEVLLKEWRKDKTNKVLIFTKSVKLLDMLDFHLNTKSFPFLRLDGSIKQNERMPMIDKFNHDPDVFIFLISTLAGGTGLNLTGANKVVIFDPNWNPAHDLQAMDRAFRFGQVRDVAVYRLLGAGSVEELIYARQIYKQQQMAIGYEASVQTRYFEGVQGDNARQGELFGINNIFTLHEDKLATKMAIEKANLAELDWALANMDAGGKGKKHAKPANELVDADAKIKEDGVNFKGLGALLFDDEPPPTALREEDVIKKTLGAIGVTYSHMNDDILVPSRIEAARTKKTLQKVRKRQSAATAPRPASAGTSGAPPRAPTPPAWPPIRRHHKAKAQAKAKAAPTPEQLLRTRQRALVRLGMIGGPQDVPTFAREFAHQTETMQQAILAELDTWTADNPEAAASSSDSGVE
ncbi:hypothetical protein HYPSUDRAFT_164868 [Hypholoma sublateritium FD-334 SS-4]|uniref:Helicase ATP-binding domain-containing protein n=1 Tax=Hypholoma sublateritium (strain FD-334 SS-4) TaxID=945553 RepID=A0A0D2L5L0_HYPSF|nr:hypothetical protein HYPSUDRAFT_164868 [Hypholoma sublateritium FD-334 SS-4]